jgi:hypothetical protein
MPVSSKSETDKNREVAAPQQLVIQVVESGQAVTPRSAVKSASNPNWR